MDRQFAEQPAERFVLLVREILIAKEDHQVLHKRVVHFLELLIAERSRQVDPGDLGADMRRQLFDLDRLVWHRALPPDLRFGTIACGLAGCIGWTNGTARITLHVTSGDSSDAAFVNTALVSATGQRLPTTAAPAGLAADPALGS